MKAKSLTSSTLRERIKGRTSALDTKFYLRASVLAEVMTLPVMTNEQVISLKDQLPMIESIANQIREDYLAALPKTNGPIPGHELFIIDGDSLVATHYASKTAAEAKTGIFQASLRNYLRGKTLSFYHLRMF